MVSPTLFLTAGMPRNIVLEHLEKVQKNRSVNAIHVVDYDFGREEEIAEQLIQLLHFDDRPWHTIKLAQCRGKFVHRMVEAITTTNVRRLILSPTPHTARSCLMTLATGLTLSSATLLTLSIQDVRLNQSLLNLLTTGLVKNSSIVDLSFTNCRFSEDDSSHLLLGDTLTRMGGLQHLSFSNCRLSDQQCQDIVSSLTVDSGDDDTQTGSFSQVVCPKKQKLSLMELNLDGNRCQTLGLEALSTFLPWSSLLALDLSNQKIPAGSMDLTRLMPGLEKCRLRSLQLSGNILDVDSIDALGKMLTLNQVLKIVHLAWVPLDERAMLTLGNALRRNTSVSKLVLYGCGIDNQGLGRFCHRIRQMRGLRQIDLGGSQEFDSIGLHALASALQRNTEIDQVILPATSNDTIYMDHANVIGLLCDANRAGRRFLKDQVGAPIGLWPLLLRRIQYLELPNMLDGMELPSILPAAPITDDEDDDDDDNDGNRENNNNDEDDDMMSIDNSDETMDMCLDSDEGSSFVPSDPGAMRRASVLYYMLRNGPLLQL